MPLTTYLINPFEHEHESEMFDRLAVSLANKTDKVTDPYILIGNITVNGGDLDALLVKTDGISVIEFKAHGGLVVFDENLPWQVGTSRVRGGGRANPFLQVRVYRHAVHHFFREKSQSLLLPYREVAWHNVAAKIVFGRPVSFDDSTLGTAARLWFSISDLDRCAEEFVELKSRGFNLTADEVNRVPGLFRLSDELKYTRDQKTVASVERDELVAYDAEALGQARKLVYLKEFFFRDHLHRLSNLGGAKPQVVERVRGMFVEIQRGLNPFESLPVADESRIVGAKRYNLGQGCEIVLIEHESILPTTKRDTSRSRIDEKNFG